MSLSLWFPDSQVITGLRMHFDNEEQDEIDSMVLNNITVLNDELYELKYKNKVFHIHGITGDVQLVEELLL